MGEPRTLEDRLGISSDEILNREDFTSGFLWGWNMCMSNMYCLILDGASSFEIYYTALSHWNTLHDRVDKGLWILDIVESFLSKRPYKGLRGKKGYVYVLRADNGMCKIGQTTQLDDRIKQLGIQLPYELELVHVVGTDHVLNAEHLLHNRYARKRKRGEWFALSDEDIEEIKTLDYLHAASGDKVALWFARWKPSQERQDG